MMDPSGTLEGLWRKGLDGSSVCFLPQIAMAFIREPGTRIISNLTMNLWQPLYVMELKAALGVWYWYVWGEYV